MDTLIKPAYILTDTVYVDFFADVLVASCNYSLIQFNAIVTDSICEYLWEFGDGGISVDPNPVYPYLTAGEYSVSLTVTDCNGCSSTLYKVGYVLVPGPYGTIAFSDDTICVEHEFEIYISVASTDTLTLYLDNGDVISIDVAYSDSLTTIIIPYTYTASGVYLPSVLLADTNSCLSVISGTDSVWVGNNPTAEYLVPDPTQCFGSPFTFTDSSSGLDSIVLWVWNTGDSFFFEDASITFNHFYADTGLYNTSLYVFTEYGCVDSMFIDVNVLPYPVTTLTNDTALCPGQSVPLAATGGNIYTWTPSADLSDPTSANPVATPDSTTLYTVEVGNGYCSVFDSVLVTVVDQLILNAGPDTSLCIGDEIQLYANFITEVSINNITYYWSPPDFLSDPNIPNPVSSALDDIVYTIYASCGNLNDTADADIKISIPPDVEIPEDTIIIIQGQSVLLTSVVVGGDPPLIYEWQPTSEVDCPGCEEVNVTPDNNTIYSCQITDVLGCTDIDFVLVRVLTCDETLFLIPNLMTPNGDGRNDVFKFNFEGGVIGVRDINVYDRWGELMFHTDNIDEHWDGYFNGVLCNPGVYVYTFIGICLDGTETVVKGNVTLVK
jgi:gliding motility-associated-like protein